MRAWLLLLLMLMLTGPMAWADASRDALEGLTVLCYHDVRERRRDALDDYTIEAAELVNHFAWLREHGYRPVSLEQVVAAQRGGKPLPDKPVLLTFDDGYRSFHTLVYPLLQLFDYPALLAVVGSWIDQRPVDLSGGANVPPLLEWAQIRDMLDSGLVEVASHSHELHQGIPGNPQGNLMAAAATRRYDPDRRRYESDQEYEHRVRADLARSIEAIERNTGRRPRAMVWPYGYYNATTVRLARELGLSVSVGLARKSTTHDSLGLHLGRVLMQGNPSSREFAADLLDVYPEPPVRALFVTLDMLYDPSPAAQEEKLSRLLDRIEHLGINTVYLQGFHDARGDGRVLSVYFPGSDLPMRADLLARVTWQLHTRLGVRSYLWLPATPDVATLDGRRTLIERYAQAARHALLHGLLFRDAVAPADSAAYAALIHDIREEAQRHRAPLRLARELPPGATIADTAALLPQALADYDDVVMRARPADAAQAQWLARQLQALPDFARARVVINVGGAGDSLADNLTTLQRAGIASLAVETSDTPRHWEALVAARHVLSLRTEAR